MLLVVGALRAETLPVAAALRGRQHHNGLIQGILGNTRVSVLTCGVGQRRAEARTSAVLAQGAFDGVISIGTCGALIDTLAIGAVVEGGAEDGLGPLGHGPTVRVCTVSRAVWTVTRRDQLAAQGWQVVEMEAAAVARAARQHGIVASALKVVSDHAGAGENLRPGPVSFARFQVRALRLSQRRLVPALVAVLARSGAAGR